jgi:hypothetical protein
MGCYKELANQSNRTKIRRFSDLVWFGVWKVEYLEHISPQQIHLFRLQEKEIMRLIALKIENESVDFTTKLVLIGYW